MYQEKFVKLLKNKMTEEHINQTQVSKITGFDKAVISRIISGKKYVSYETICILADRLSLWPKKTPDELENIIKKQIKKINFLSLISLFELVIVGILLWK